MIPSFKNIFLFYDAIGHRDVIFISETVEVTFKVDIDNGKKFFFLYQGSLQALFIKLTINQQIWKIIPKNVDETRSRTQVRYNHLQ